MTNARMKLPAFKMQREILNLINGNQVVLISGETGNFTMMNVSEISKQIF